jgi:hypothetical protein
MRPRQVLTIIGARDWSRLGALLDASTSHAGMQQWNAYRASTVDQADELLLLPARHGTLYTRP